MPSEQIHKKSVQACENLCLCPEITRASVVMLFLSLPREIDTAHAVLKAFQQNKTVVVPSIVWSGRRLVPVTMTDFNCPMTQDRHGLRHPADGQPIPLSDIDLVVVPGLGFDHLGNRIGRGGGFYDRFLSHNGFRGTACGLAFEEQIVERVPVHDHDVPLDLLVTDTGVRRFKHKPKNSEPSSVTAKK